MVWADLNTIINLMLMLFYVLLSLPSITGFTDHIQVKAPLAYSNQRAVRVVEMSELIA